MTEKYTPKDGDYIRVQGNKQYLPVPSRVQWFRGEHPTWTISTSVVELDWNAGYAVMRAEVLDDTGRLIASGMKTETRKGFGDFVEKAETGAVGRALARTGYGTEDALDLEGERYADAPIESPEGGERGKADRRHSPATTRSPASYDTLRDRLALVASEHHLGADDLSRLADEVGVPKGTRATEDQLHQIIARIESPAGAAHPGDTGAEEARASAPVTDTPASQDDSAEPDTSTASVSPSPGDMPSAAPSLDEILAVSGGELVPPKPGTPEYRALPNGTERSQAKAYWEGQKV